MSPVSDLAPVPGTGGRRTPPRVSLATTGEVSPLVVLSRRMIIALFILVATIAIVYFDRDGYHDDADNELSLLDAAYYATVTLSTTGYGDITPYSPNARLLNVLLITPMRVAFLIVLIGTTVEALTSRSRELWRVGRWRKRVHDHVVIVGYGVKGRTAAETLLLHGTPKEQIVIVDPDPEEVAEANAKGLVGVIGDATRSDVLRRAAVDQASRILVTAHRDDTAVLVTLTARQLNHHANIAVAVRESENVELVRQSGADFVITSSDAIGRVLGMGSVSPAVVEVLGDLMSIGSGFELHERDVTPREEGRSPRTLEHVVLAVVRDGQVHRFYEPTVGQLLRGDRVVVVRPAEDLPWAARAGEDLPPDPVAPDLDHHRQPPRPKRHDTDAGW